MCTNYHAPGEYDLNELKLIPLKDLYRRTPWRPDIYQDYLAPIVASVNGELEARLAGFAFWPRDMLSVVEPMYPHARQNDRDEWTLGPCEWQRIGLTGWRPMCVAGIWRTVRDSKGVDRDVMSMVTINADGHPFMSRMHKPGDEKRSVVILRPTDWEEWLTTSNVEAARSMLQLYPADEMAAESTPKSSDQETGDDDSTRQSARD
ncbi:SOS response-associated peptidase family protein [Burkholderia guangdongensis]|uniref:SOS response-associated peptidase family protein n=1 Tax=Burkholderia guangdongensis TaxID=1792500 RepID=UPI0015CE57E5|nr:SOS response-associated peptidase family protein [Burkholderia guangdongensis]